MEIKTNNIDINYSDEGKGDVVVLLHGFTESLRIWKDFSKVLSYDFRVICIDLPGHGKSECISEIHTMDLMADVVKSVLDHLSVESCVMIGHSMGGYVSLAFARKYCKSLKGLGLFHSNASADGEKAREMRMRAIDAIRGNHYEFLYSFIPSLFAPGNTARLEGVINELVESAKRMSKEAIIAAQMGMKDRLDSIDILESAQYPVMFIAGHKDSRIQLTDIQSQSALCETAYCLFLRNVGHMGFVEEKQKTVQFVRWFADACARV